MKVYSGRSHDERFAQRKREIQRSQEPPGGEMAVFGTEADREHSCGQLSPRGKEVWQRGAGLDGNGKSE